VVKKKWVEVGFRLVSSSMRRLSCQKISAHGFWLEGATLARREWIALPYELARESGSRLDPMSLRAECDHLVSGLALRRLCRRTVITPRLASIPSLLLKAVLFLFVWFSHALPPGSTPGTLFFLGKFNQRFAQTLPSHLILLGHTVIISCLVNQQQLVLGQWMKNLNPPVHQKSLIEYKALQQPSSRLKVVSVGAYALA
jgi:hypothetical protein